MAGFTTPGQLMARIGRRKLAIGLMAAVITAALVLVGYTLTLSRAAVTSASLEAESGSINSPAADVAASGASGGRALQFGPAVQPSPAPQPTPSPSSGKLSWAQPALQSPTTLNAKCSMGLGSGDYIIKMPATPLTCGLVISGGHNVVLIGGEINLGDNLKACLTAGEAMGIKIKDVTGTIHIEGVHIGGYLCEGIQIDMRSQADTIVQLQNIRTDTVHGSFDTNHADIVQTYAGPKQLRIDHLTGSTTYQGFMLDPTDVHFGGPLPTLFDFRNINMNDAEGTSVYMIFQSGSYPISIQNVWVNPAPERDMLSEFLRSVTDGNVGQLSPVQVGTPPGGDFVPVGQAGLNYVTPGYQ